MIRKLIKLESKTITAAAILIGALSFVSRLLGIFRDRILAAEFGAGPMLDIYYAAFRLPDLVYNLVIIGAVSAGLIPLFSALIARQEDEEAWHLINTVLHILLTGVAVLCAVLWVVAPWLMPALTPGFTADQHVQLVDLTRIMFLSPILLGLSGVASAVLQSFRRFFVYSLAPIFYNVGIIAGALFLVPIVGIHGLAWGVVLGALLHCSLQFLPLPGLGYRYHWSWDWRNKHVREVISLMIPRTLTMFISQFNGVVVTVAASLFAAGSLAVYSFANNLQSFPIGLFSISLAVAALPVFSQLMARDDREGFVNAFSSTFRQILFFIVPVSVMMYVLRAHIVRLVLGAGAFNWQDTRLTAACLGVFMVTLFAQGVTPLLVRGFYALHNTRTPFYIGLLSTGIVVGSLVGVAWLLGYDNAFRLSLAALLKIDDVAATADIRLLAIPVAIGAGALFDIIAMLWLLRRLVGRLDGWTILDSAWRVLFASLAGGLAAYGTLQVIAPSIVTTTVVGLLVQSAAAGIVGLGGFILVGVMLNVREMYVVAGSLQRRLFRSAQVVENISVE